MDSSTEYCPLLILVLCVICHIWNLHFSEKSFFPQQVHNVEEAYTSLCRNVFFLNQLYLKYTSRAIYRYYWICKVVMSQYYCSFIFKSAWLVVGLCVMFNGLVPGAPAEATDVAVKKPCFWAQSLCIDCSRNLSPFIKQTPL